MQHAVQKPIDVLGGWLPPLIEALEQQHTLVTQLAEIARAQATLIAERRTDRLLEVLTRRQSIIDEFTASQSRVNALTRNLDRHSHDIGMAQRDHIRSLIDAIACVLNDVMRRDQADQESLETGRSAVLAEMTGINAVRTARAAYTAPARGATSDPPRFADKKG